MPDGKLAVFGPIGILGIEFVVHGHTVVLPGAELQILGNGEEARGSEIGCSLMKFDGESCIAASWATGVYGLECGSVGLRDVPAGWGVIVALFEAWVLEWSAGIACLRDRCRWIGRVLQGVAVRSRNSVAIAASVLTTVRRVGGRPGLIVEGAVETLWEAVLREDVDIKEDAGLVCSVCCWVSAVIGGLDIAR